MEQQGLLADPKARLMRLNDQVWRACRVAIDVELHLGIMDLPPAVIAWGMGLAPPPQAARVSS